MDFIQAIVNFLSRNYEWLFSGIGVGILSGLVSLTLERSKRKSLSQKSGNDSVNIQIGGGNIVIGNKTDDEILSEIKITKGSTFVEKNLTNKYSGRKKPRR